MMVVIFDDPVENATSTRPPRQRTDGACKAWENQSMDALKHRAVEAPRRAAERYDVPHVLPSNPSGVLSICAG